ncbi:MAG: hypothetical protein JW863_20030 [Chitinispirillaceae bacterium]|nr:hypothetical protein [Chitinispirillaceae bacterium]
MMKKIILTVAIISHVAPVWSTGYQLHGMVTSYHFKEPVESCMIVLKPESPTAVADTVVTDSNGFYAIGSVSPGVYMLEAGNSLYYGIPRTISVTEAVTANFQVALRSHMIEGDFPVELTTDMSPVFIFSEMKIGNAVKIGEGVTIYHQDILRFTGPSLRATGTSGNPVTFISLNQETGCCYFLATEQELSSCSFSNEDKVVIGLGDGHQRSVVDSCFFSTNRFYTETAVLSMRNSTIRTFETVNFLVDSLFYYGNSLFGFENKAAPELDCQIEEHGVISDNNFPSSRLLLKTSGDTVINNIFSGLNIVPGERYVNGFIAYNCIDHYSRNAADTAKLTGIGKVVIVNDNGFPCDLFLNIFTDPLFLDVSTGKLHPSSPCFKAGLNGTNIGVSKEEPDFTALKFRTSYQNEKPVVNATAALIFGNTANGSPLPGNTIGVDSRSNVFLLNGRRAAMTGNAGTYGASRRISRGFYVLKR